MCPVVCWFRKEMTLPDPLPVGPATIQLGVVEKMDTTYINGHWVGASAWVENPRVYRLKQGVLAPGKNLVAIRVFKLKPNGGFMGKPDDLRLVLGDTVIALAGEWKGALSVDASPPHPMPMGFENWPVIPSVLYQGMINPVAPFAIRGAIWYQGEANFERAWQYRTLLPAMIGDWRKRLARAHFHFTSSACRSSCITATTRLKPLGPNCGRPRLSPPGPSKIPPSPWPLTPVMRTTFIRQTRKLSVIGWLFVRWRRPMAKKFHIRALHLNHSNICRGR